MGQFDNPTSPSDRDGDFQISITVNGNSGTVGTKLSIKDENGRVGIGTNNPSGQLHIFGTATQDVFAGMGPDLVNGPALNFGYAGSSFARGAGFFNVRPDALATGVNPSLRYATANITRMIITNAGRVGIGTLAPSSKLHVDGGDIRVSGGSLIEAAITPRTRVIVPVHYAGVACEMDAIMLIAKRHNLHVVEDAAQSVMASHKERALGRIGDFGAFSFHETKNVISGEGGALLANNADFTARAEIIREKGTDRSRFFRGEVDKYSWQDIGSSFLPGELIAAFLWAQLEEADCITQTRLASWQQYHELIEPLEASGLLRRPIVPNDCQHNAHMYYVLVASEVERVRVLEMFRVNDICSVFHYVPLHSSPAGQRYGKTHGSLEITSNLSERLVRLPLWFGISESDQIRIVEVLKTALEG
jgi:dTDP-4-amino-4,6-dideoxygalactose transaminase